MKNKYIAIALVVVAIAGVGGLIWFTGSGNDLVQSTSTNITPDASAVVATLNGGETTITRGELDAQIQALAKNPQVQVPDASQAEARANFERLVLDNMIGSILLFDEAKRQGFTADDAAVDSELATITAQYESAAVFEAALTTAKLSRESLRENIRRQLITNQHYAKITAEHPVTVRAEEIRVFYDTQVVPQDAKIVFEDVEDKIKTQIEQQKMQDILTGIINELRQSADVKVLI